MLGSITPLGERGRGQPYAWTIGFFLIGSVVAGAALGAGLGAIGGAIVARETITLPLLAGLIGIGLAIDMRMLPIGLPTVRRQVDETWLTRFRGWVYGVGFGFQLGLGVVTIVATSLVYVALAAALLSGSVVGGAVIGGAFGVVRGLCAAIGGVVRAPAHLARVAGLVSRLERPAHRATLLAQCGVLIALIGVIAL